MTEREIKRKLEDDGFRIIDVARHMQTQFPITVKSSESMLRDLIAGRRWFPIYAEWLEQNYGTPVDKPDWVQPVRERMKQVA